MLQVILGPPVSDVFADRSFRDPRERRFFLTGRTGSPLSEIFANGSFSAPLSDIFAERSLGLEQGVETTPKCTHPTIHLGPAGRRPAWA